MSLKPLKFIHITKCAGTSIEDAAHECGIEWGRFDKEYCTSNHWHMPFSQHKTSFITKYDWFTVVRNPYSRILSEYYCKWGGIGKTNIRHTKEEMNAYIIKKIKNRHLPAWHYEEQYKYLHPSTKIHIIKFENLNEEFDALMTTYGIKGVVLQKTNVSVKKGTNYTVKDFSNELIELINTVYDKDFEYFQYDKISTG